jgi:hypothetical protein
LITNGNVVTDFPFLNLATTHRPFEQELVRVSNSLYAAPIVMVRILMNLYDYMFISC